MITIFSPSRPRGAERDVQGRQRRVYKTVARD